ncbi:hypothetical protein C8R43DRAFT_1118972 [Mycena crocata]|nr:hypothetical protein C8R43DRAFT_1132454 [Mycena crocata]KAJ7176439.1 hypothetical protein C8R43DRAFT_1118972 [Mycena crocata]
MTPTRRLASPGPRILQRDTRREKWGYLLATGEAFVTVKSKLLRMRIVLGEDIVQGVVNDLIHCVSDVLQSPERLFEEPTAPLNILLFALDDEGLHHLIRDLHDAMISFLKRQRVRSQRGSPSPAAETPSRHKCRSEPSVSARRRAGPPQPLKERSEVSLHIDTFICANMALAVLNVDEMRKRNMSASRITKNGLRAVTLRGYLVDSLMEDEVCWRRRDISLMLPV